MITDCLLALNKLIPQTLDRIDPPMIEMWQNEITAVLNKVLAHDITPLQRQDLTDIRALAQRAKEMGLLSKEGEAATQRIAKKCRAIGISLFTSPLNFTLQATDGEVKVNVDLFKKNSEIIQKIVEDSDTSEGIPVQLSIKAVEFLMYCLHAPKREVIVLPDDVPLIQDLIRFAAGFGFNKLLKKLEDPVANYVDTHRQNAFTDDWLSVFYEVKQSHPETAVKWARVLMPDFIKKYSIPVEVSELPYDFEVAIEHRNAFFNEEVRDIIKYLPIMLLIKDDNELQLFLETCKKNKLENLLPMKALCRFKVLPERLEQSKEIAKTSNIHLTIEQRIVPPGTRFFGRDHWEKYIGHVDDLPLPDELIELLDSEIVLRGGFRSGKKWKDLFMLFLLPATVDGVTLTSCNFIELVKNPKNGGHPGKYKNERSRIFEAFGQRPVERSAWVLLSIGDLEGIKALKDSKIELIPGCERPALLPAQVGIMTHFIDNGERLLPESSTAIMGCKERVIIGDIMLQVTVGDFGDEGLTVSSTLSGVYKGYYSEGAMRVFTPGT